MSAFFIIVIALILFVGYATGSDALTSVVSSLSNETGDTSPQNTRNDTGVSLYQSDGSLTGSVITSDPTTWPGSDKVWNICTAIALAEGYNLGVGCAPYDLNNPGDLSPGDEDGQPTCGGAQQHGGSAVIVFCTAEGGWSALYAKFTNIVNGRSSVYSSSLTWTQVAQKYAGNWQAWVNNVTSYLGVDPSSTPAQYVNS
jgi:hypothetical protein